MIHGYQLRGIAFAVVAPGPPPGRGQGDSAQGINDGHTVDRVAYILENGVPELLTMAIAVFVQGAVDPLCPEIVVAVSEIVGFITGSDYNGV
jgi:hypothetical protein